MKLKIDGIEKVSKQYEVNCKLYAIRFKMVKLYKNFNINKNHKGSIILIGNFDGVHLGHQKLFKLAKSYKKKYNLKIGVLTFEPMPKMFFNKYLKNFRFLALIKK